MKFLTLLLMLAFLGCAKKPAGTGDKVIGLQPQTDRLNSRGLPHIGTNRLVMTDMMEYPFFYDPEFYETKDGLIRVHPEKAETYYEKEYYISSYEQFIQAIEAPGRKRIYVNQRIEIFNSIKVNGSNLILNHEGNGKLVFRGGQFDFEGEPKTEDSYCREYKPSSSIRLEITVEDLKVTSLDFSHLVVADRAIGPIEISSNYDFVGSFLAIAPSSYVVAPEDSFSYELEAQSTHSFLRMMLSYANVTRFPDEGKTPLLGPQSQFSPRGSDRYQVCHEFGYSLTESTGNIETCRNIGWAETIYRLAACSSL